ncbi:PilN domain-containing protein [Maribacter litoralis]|uniref:PilN domain-containing protein n=1 Tax=Maribacter litoralis TaxID=2059726 RepID=UPI003F5CC5C0
MIAKIIKHITEGSVFSGLEINTSEKGDIYYFLEIKKLKDELVISKSLTLNKIDDIKLHINRTTPLFLCFNNDSILTKQLKNSNTSSEAALVNEAFPNLDIKNFYWEIIQKSKNSIISISRKEFVDTILIKLSQFKITPFQISLGVSGIKEIIPYTNVEMIELKKHDLKLNNEEIVELKSNTINQESVYQINGLKLSNLNLLIFGQILRHLNSNQSFTNFSNQNQKLKNQLKNERFFNSVGKFALAFFGILILVNFIFYNHYFSKISQLKSNLLASNSQKENLVKLENIVKNKQDKINTISNSSNSKSTFYLDNIAKSVPQTILLNNIDYQPLIKNIQKNKPIIFSENYILLSGISTSNNEFSRWIEKLEKNEWIKSIETLDYDFVNNSSSEFSIEIKINGK